MARRITLAAIVAAVIVLFLAAAPQSPAAVSFVDKQVQAGGLLIQNYITGTASTTSSRSRPGPWSGRAGASRTRRASGRPTRLGSDGPRHFTRHLHLYALSADGKSYTLTMHLSSGAWKFTNSMKAWVKTERNTESRQNLLLLQRYVEVYAAINAGQYPTADVMTTRLGVDYTWPATWTGSP